MNTKWIVAGLGVLAVIVISTAALAAPKVSTAQQTASVVVSQPTPAPAPTPSSSAKTYTLAVVATHNSGSSCWTAINGKVYDVTSWINQHPGGPDKILGLCGTDGSAAFNDQHGGQRRPANELASFYVGILTQ